MYGQLSTVIETRVIMYYSLLVYYNFNFNLHFDMYSIYPLLVILLSPKDTPDHRYGLPELMYS